MPGVEVDDHVIDEGGDVEILLDGLVLRGRRQPLIGQGHHRIPGDFVPLLHFRAQCAIPFEDVEAAVLGQIGGGVMLIEPFDEIVNAPVQPVDVQIHEDAVDIELAHGLLRVPHPLISQQQRVVYAPNPAIGEIGPHHQPFEAGHVGAGKDGLFQMIGPVIAPEIEPEGVLGREIGASAVAAMNANARVDLKAGVVFPEQLDGRGALPIQALFQRIGVDAPLAAEHVGPAGDDGKRGQRLQIIHQVVVIVGMIDDGGIHFVIRGRLLTVVQSPGGGKACGIGGLVGCLRGEDVCVGAAGGWQKARAVGHGPQDGRAIDVDGPGVNLARAFGGRVAIGGVADDGRGRL